MPRRILLALLTLLLTLTAAPGFAQRLMMVRSSQAFPEAMLTLQTSIGEHGYTVSRVQRVDIGLTGSGYKTDKYRIVFFAKPDEVKKLVAAHPQLVPYLPLKITIFAEEHETLVVTFDPTMLADLVDGEDERYLLMRWRSDIESILDDMRNTD